MLETAGNREVNEKPSRHEDALSTGGSGEVDKKPDPHENVLETAGIGEVYKTPKPYKHLLEKICKDCKLLDHILWRNVQLVESRFESRFRSSRENDSACFLQCKSYVSSYYNLC